MEYKEMVTRFTFEKKLDLIDFSCMILYLANKEYKIREYELSQSEGYMKACFYKEDEDFYIELYDEWITTRRMSPRDSLELYEELTRRIIKL